MFSCFGDSKDAERRRRLGDRFNYYSDKICALLKNHNPNVFAGMDDVLSRLEKEDIDGTAFYLRFHCIVGCDTTMKMLSHHDVNQSLVLRNMRYNRFVIYYFILKGYRIPNWFMPLSVNGIRNIPCSVHPDIDESCIRNDQFRYYRFVLRSGGVGFIVRVQRKFRRNRAARKIQRWWLAIAYNPHHPVGARIQLARYAKLALTI